MLLFRIEIAAMAMKNLQINQKIHENDFPGQVKLGDNFILII